ncbi:MAG: YHYH protein [Nonlabens sp.]|nr:YHYH protein [Nonlabens sp.]
MKNKTLYLVMLLIVSSLHAQTNPVITSWLQNTTGITGRHYVSGNPTPIVDNVAANVQQVQYSANWVYVNATGIPAYITGPFLDRNPSLATDQNAIYRFPLTPSQNTGTPSVTTGGNIGVFINGVSLFDYRDGVAWNNTTQALCGGPGNPTCPGGPAASQAWNRDAIPAEMAGFDCNKAHPANGNYHHHQNPSAFDLDLIVLSNICSTYPADGLYVIDPNAHSPLIGFAYDGFPIYGAYAFANTNGTGAITRMKSSYQLRTNTTRVNGPAVNATYFNGYFREDYVYVANSGTDYLDEHNGRFAITPEYPNGTYCYYATVDANHNSAYPYVVGPTFYGNKTASKVTSVNESTTPYTLSNENHALNDLMIYPNPAQDFVAIQTAITYGDLQVELINSLGQVVKEEKILQGSTLSIIDTTSLYNGIYFLKITSASHAVTHKIIMER